MINVTIFQTVNDVHTSQLLQFETMQAALAFIQASSESDLEFSTDRAPSPAVFQTIQLKFRVNIHEQSLDF